MALYIISKDRKAKPCSITQKLIDRFTEYCNKPPTKFDSISFETDKKGKITSLTIYDQEGKISISKTNYTFESYMISGQWFYRGAYGDEISKYQYTKLLNTYLKKIENGAKI